MGKNIFYIILFLFSISLFSQEKKIDSLLTKNKYQLEQKLQIPIVEFSQHNKYYRLSYFTTIIDVWKDSLNNYDGFITKYIFERKNNSPKTDTIFKKYILNEFVSKKIVDEIDSINDIPDNEHIKGWKFGFDGITYFFKLLNEQDYLEKSYWSPDSQDSTIVEVRKIKYLLETIKSAVNADSLKVDFEKIYKSNHYYTNGSSLSFFVLPNKNASINYVGTYRLPFGLNFGCYQNKFRNRKLDIGVGLSYKLGFSGNYLFSTAIGKYNIFKLKNYDDGLILDYEKSKLDYTNFGKSFETKTIRYYGNYYSNISLEIGFTKLKNDINYNGFKFGIGKRFKKIDMSSYYNFSTFENKITNYEVGVRKRIRYKNKYLLDLDLYYEKLFYFNSLNFGIYFPLFSYQN